MSTVQASALRRRLSTILPSDRVFDDPADCLAYGYDNSRRVCLPQAVVFPLDHEEVVAVVAACHAHRTPLVARGRGTNTTGASVPLQGGVVMSLERMNRVLEYRPADRLIVVQAGCINADVQRQVAADGLFWAPDPTSAGYSTVGGNLACGAGGPRAVKYGTARDNVLGLRAVTGDARTLVTGGQTTKGVVGYDLTRLLVGSEGTLAVVTEATLKLLPRPPSQRTLRACYVDAAAAVAAVVRVMGQSETPASLEFMDGTAVRLAQAWRDTGVPAGTGALLLMDVDGTPESVSLAQAAVAAAAEGDGLVELKVAADAQEAEALWACRKALSPSLRQVAPKKVNEDVAVPVSRLPDLLATLERLSAQYALQIVNFGHAGNGNIHVNLMADPDDARQMAVIGECLSEVFRTVLALGGTLSGEHGVGIDKRAFVGWEIDPVTLAQMQALRAVFDPAGILNPGKTLPGAGAAT
jgi:D-lactate dehydrogenase (quinone)